MSRNSTWWEDQLADAYKRLGHPDLAHCVKGGRRYLWLQKLCNPTYPELAPARDFQAFRELILNDGTGERLKPKEEIAWVDQLKIKYRDNPSYQILSQRGYLIPRGGRNPAKERS